MFTIGEFSIITRLPVKTLRYYHDEGILMPDYIDEDSGYRYYRESSARRAAVIALLRGMNFPIAEIRVILSEFTEDAQMVDILLSQREKIESAIGRFKTINASIDAIVREIRSNEMNAEKYSYNIEEKILEDMIFAGKRFKGKYSDVGGVFGTAARSIGKWIAGKPMSLYHDGEYREGDADIEAGFPVSKTVRTPDLECRILPGGRAVTLMHRGPYEKLGPGYTKILAHLETKGLSMDLPTREVYHKGPGVFFRGNPNNYLTEIQIPVKQD